MITFYYNGKNDAFQFYLAFYVLHALSKNVELKSNFWPFLFFMSNNKNILHQGLRKIQKKFYVMKTESFQS